MAIVWHWNCGFFEDPTISDLNPPDFSERLTTWQERFDNFWCDICIAVDEFHQVSTIFTSTTEKH